MNSIGLSDRKYALCTYHPVTMEGGSADEYIKSFLAAIKAYPEFQFIVIKSNADQGGARINDLLGVAEPEIDNLYVYTSLGVRRYISLMKSTEHLLGNSLSEIIEIPAFHV